MKKKTKKFECKNGKCNRELTEMLFSCKKSIKRFAMPLDKETRALLMAVLKVHFHK